MSYYTNLFQWLMVLPATIIEIANKLFLPMDELGGLMPIALLGLTLFTMIIVKGMLHWFTI